MKDAAHCYRAATKLFEELLGDIKSFAIMKKHFKAYVEGLFRRQRTGPALELHGNLKRRTGRIHNRRFLSFAIKRYTMASWPKGKKSRSAAPLSLYRKYRPMSFGEVRGQEKIVSVLEAAVKQEKIAHAYLFAGGRGTGKTSMARILAHSLGTDEQDMYEMDAASNRGIDEVRRAARGRRDPAVQFNLQILYYRRSARSHQGRVGRAFSKRSKSRPSMSYLSWRPPNLTACPRRSISRCQVFNFKKPSHEVLKKLALDVAKKEGASLAPRARSSLRSWARARFAIRSGSCKKCLPFRRTKSSLKKRSPTVVGAPASQTINQFLEALAAKNIAEAIATFHRATDAGAEPRSSRFSPSPKCAASFCCALRRRWSRNWRAVQRG